MHICRRIAAVCAVWRRIALTIWSFIIDLLQDCIPALHIYQKLLSQVQAVQISESYGLTSSACFARCFRSCHHEGSHYISITSAVRLVSVDPKPDLLKDSRRKCLLIYLDEIMGRWIYSKSLEERDCCIQMELWSYCNEHPC